MSQPPPANITQTTRSAAGPGDAPGQQRLDQVRDLCRSANRLRRHLEHTVLEDAGLTWTSYDVLHLSVMHGPIDTGILARLAGTSTGTVTRAAKALIRRGLLQRAIPRDDLRRSQLTATADGCDLNEQLRTRLVDELTRLLRAPSGAEFASTDLQRQLLHVG